VQSGYDTGPTVRLDPDCYGIFLNRSLLSARAVRAAPKQRKQALLFVNKKKQKNFINFSFRRFSTVRSGAKVFWFFFSKKNLFLSFPFSDQKTDSLPIYRSFPKITA